MRSARTVFAPFLLALLLVAPLLAAMPAGTIHSNLHIDPGKQFILGGDQRGAFRMAAKNTGTVPVEIRERPKGGGIFGKATLAPGQRGALRFLAGSTAVLLNPSRTAGNMDLTITGDTNLGMTYEPVQQTTIPPPAPTQSSDSK